MRALLIILFFSIFNLGFSQTSGVVNTGGYIFSSPEADINKTKRYCADGQSIFILGRSRVNSDYLFVQIDTTKGYMHYSAIKNSYRISYFEPPTSVEKNNYWNGNGSGLLISTTGYIVTNYHVIKDVTSIEVEFKHNGIVKSFKAKVIQTDLTNDLAILKIDDASFTNLLNIPYSFKTTTSDVGTSVFALGYPMALSIMGTEIKFTDGKISSKSGYKGDITVYQTTTPMQPGNSGGPLFDFDGNLIAINSAKLRPDIADNVSYSIKSSYILNLIDVLPETIPIPSNKSLIEKSLTDKIKILSDYVVLIKTK